MVESNNNSFVTVILAALILVIGYDGVRLRQEQHFNKVLASGSEISAKIPDAALRQFVDAYTLQQAGEFKKSVRAYAAVNTNSNPRLQMDVKFNLANLYFREAIRLGESGAKDLSMPLIELAKQNYKEILRLDSGDWDSKFNLELALVLAPDTDPADAMQEQNPEHSPRALTKVKLREPLP